MHLFTNGDGRPGDLAGLSTGLVQLYASYCDQTPTSAKSHVADDWVVCMLRDPYNAMERTLIDRGEVETVHRMRDGFRRAMDKEFRRVFDENFGGPLIAHISTMHVDPDLVADIFVLKPSPDGSPAGNGSAAARHDVIPPDWVQS